MISIHALREEGDAACWPVPHVPRMISIHALREEGDKKALHNADVQIHFYPRPPRGGRHDGDGFAWALQDISIHALREEGDGHTDGPAPPQGISIHALREEGDRVFQAQDQAERISIHALREEGDATTCPPSLTTWNFYPRPPRGGRRDFGVSELDYIQFLSTPSARRATHRAAAGRLGQVISIHALREEGDCHGVLCRCDDLNFYPRPPRGGRPEIEATAILDIMISIHALREEGD